MDNSLVILRKVKWYKMLETMPEMMRIFEILKGVGMGDACKMT